MMKTLQTETSAGALVDEIKSQIPGLMEAVRVPGLSLVLIREGEIAWIGSFGLESRVTEAQITPETLFEAASLSKPVFAYACLKLCERGLLDLDTPLANYWSEPFVPDESRAERITVRQVLCHTPGLPNWRSEGKPLKMITPPGERFSYSGEGYMYLQAVVAATTGQNPATYLWEHTLQPLGMDHSRFTWTGDEDLRAAVGHDEKGQPAEKGLWPKMMAAASLHCTAVDYARFMIAVMRPSISNPAYLRPGMAAEMLTPQIPLNDSVPWRAGWPKSRIRTLDELSWGLGWGLQHTAAGDSIWHWGDNGNYRAFAIGWPEEGHGLIVMTNSKNGQKVIDNLLRNMVGGEYPALDWLY